MNKSWRYVWFAVPLILFLGLALLFFTRIGKDSSELPSARLGQEMPVFRLPSLTEPETLLTQDNVKGQVVFLNVWATWCVSCLVEHPVLMQLAADGVPVIGVNYKDIPSAALQYLANNGNPFRFTISDEDGSLGIDLGVYGAPETYLLDAEGRIRYRFIGVLDANNWQTELKPRYEALKAGQPLPGEGR